MLLLNMRRAVAAGELPCDCGFENVEGVVAVMDTAEDGSMLASASSSADLLMEAVEASSPPLMNIETLMTVAACALQKRTAVFYTPGTLSMLASTQLYTVCMNGTEMWLVEKGQDVNDAARQYAREHKMVYIDSRYSHVFHMFGVATVMHEIMEEHNELDTVVLPMRLYEVGWPLVAGCAFYAKCVGAQTLANLTVHAG